MSDKHIWRDFCGRYLIKQSFHWDGDDCKSSSGRGKRRLSSAMAKRMAKILKIKVDRIS